MVGNEGCESQERVEDTRERTDRQSHPPATSGVVPSGPRPSPFIPEPKLEGWKGLWCGNMFNVILPPAPSLPSLNDARSGMACRLECARVRAVRRPS